MHKSTLNKKQIKIVIFLIFLIALVLRISFIIFYDNGKMLRNEYYASDEVYYDQIAVNFLKGKGFVTDTGLYARRGPVYPLFLAVIYFISRHSLVVVRFIQAFIGALMCTLIYLVGKENFDTKTGFIAALISAIYYPFIQESAYLLSESFFAIFLVISIFLFSRYYDMRRNYLLFTASVFLGIAILCRATILYFPLFLFFWLSFLLEFKIKKMLKLISLMFFGIFVVVAPWSLRNYKIYKTFIPVTIESGLVLYLGNNPLATGGTGGWVKWKQDQFLPENISDPNRLESDRTMFRLALDYMIENPRKTFILGYKKFINMWRPFYRDARLVNKIVMSILYIPIIVLATIGLIKSIFENFRKYAIFYCLIFYLVMIHMITISNIRYRNPVMPFLIIFAAHALGCIKDKFVIGYQA